MSASFLILDPNLHIAEASDAYRRATLLWNEDIFGCPLFEAFPDNPEDAAADGVCNLLTSLQQVLRTGQPHRMEVQRYDVRDFVAGSATWIEKYWAPLNSPVYGGDSHEVTHIIHEVADVTPAVHLLHWIDEQELATASALETIDAISQELRGKNQQLDSLREMISAMLRGESAGDTFEDIQSKFSAAHGRRYYSTTNRVPISGIYELFHRRECRWPVRERNLAEGSRFPHCPHCRDDVLYRLMCVPTRE